MNQLNTNIVKHAVFDAYGTLFDVHSAVSRHQEKLGEKAQLVSNLWRRKQLEYTWLRSLMRNYVSFSQITEDALEFAFDSNEISEKSLKKELLNSYQELACYSEIPDVLKFFKKQGLEMSILSNGTFEMLKKGVQNSNLEEYFESIFSVEKLGVFKPDQRVYKLPVEKLDCRPEEILFFSSNSWDISGASSFGFQAIWVNRFGQKSERLPGEPVLEIKTLNEVLKYFV